MADQDLELVQKFQNGDESAFNRLVLRHQHKMFNLAYKMIRNLEDAKDLTQEVFVKAYLGLRNFRGESSFSTWLYQIALNSAINYSNSKRWKNLVSLFEVKEPVATWGDPIQEMKHEETGRAIDNAVLSLPPRQRAVFVLRHYEELPYQEIAKMTGRTEGALKANYFQAVKKLQKKLAHLR
jgi:RNA polymerase sigma-70 factor (ECF subfamily)